MDPITISALISAASSAAGAFGGMSQNKANKKYQERQSQLIDELLGSLDGSGKYGQLFGIDENAFQKSFVDPAKQMFGDQIAPQIQQSSIAGGMQRSSSMDDQLTRAGVDLDQVLNQNYMNFQNQGKDRMSNMLSGLMGGQNQQPGASNASLWGGAASGFLESDAFSNLFKNKGAGTSTSQSPIDASNPRNIRPGFKQSVWSGGGAA